MQGRDWVSSSTWWKMSSALSLWRACPVLALGFRVRGSSVQPSLFPRESIIPNPHHTAMLPLRQML